jgi:hypothetical protein
VACELGVDERTLRRWIVQRPELRPVLRAYLTGKQWRLDIPATYAELESYIREIERAISQFHRRSKKHWARSGDGKKEKIVEALGFGSEKRERELRTLREAIRLKIATTALTDHLRTESEARSESRSPFDIAGNCMGLVRIIAAKYDCHVFDVSKYLDSEKTTHEDKGRFELLRALWPTRGQWDEAASQDDEYTWRRRTLREAAYDLAINNERITAHSLRRRLFLNERCEVEWKLKRFLNGIPETYSKHLSHDRRGISLRLFRERYKWRDVEKVKKLVEGLVQSEHAKDDEQTDEAGFGRKVSIMSNRHEESEKDKGALHIWSTHMEQNEEQALSPAAARAIRDVNRMMRGTSDPGERLRLEEYLRQLMREER